MVDAGSKQSREEAKARRAAQKAKREEEERLAWEEVRSRRNAQAESARLAIRKLTEELQVLRGKTTRHETLSSHLKGFYLEIDKLAKGKALIEVTPFALEQTNDIIRDARTIVAEDPYLDRIKEFVPAGNNPLYPDVLVALRVVREALERFATQLTSRKKQLTSMLRKARTILIALEYNLETDQTASIETVRERMESEPVQSLFVSSDVGEYYFDFDRLDRRSLEEYLSGEPQKDYGA